MGQVLIRNIDDAVIADYKAAAKRAGRSLEAELRETLTHARPKPKLTVEELKALSERLRAMTPPDIRHLDSTPSIRYDRDHRPFGGTSEEIDDAPSDRRQRRG